MFSLSRFAVCLWVAFPFVAVRADEAPDFIRDIRPILTEHCFECHGPDEAQREAELRLDNRAVAIAALPSGTVAIQPGDADGSELVRRIFSDDAAVVMPPPEFKHPLSADQKSLMRRWIEAGAEYAAHWAYVKPVRPAVPTTHNTDWPRNEVDAFVLSRLKAEGLTPSPEADKITLIRRLALDLTGLPPSVDDVDRFLADNSPDAYERLVDDYLASPHYGEKMAQGWLDLARFGDSSGYQDDGERLNWPYRDYIIEAFNAGMPFDQFTIENLAGDLLPTPSLSQQVASGFHRLHRYNEEGGSDPDEFRVVYVVDRTNTTATAWMGLTFGCAQCHDHKYDPVSQREFYEFSAFFNSLDGEVVISKSNSPPQVPVPSEQQRSVWEAFDRDIAEAKRQIDDWEPNAKQQFEEWLITADSGHPTEKRGAIGGVFARAVQPAFYADTGFVAPLTLDAPLSASGKLAVVNSVNNEVNVGYFVKEHPQKGIHLGLSIAEGPRFFAYAGLPDGTRVSSDAIPVPHQVEYAWSFRYEPAEGDHGRLTLEVRRGDDVSGIAHVDLKAEHRSAGTTLDAFGLAYRGFDQKDAPIELYVDDVTYTADDGERSQNFDADPAWTAVGHQENGHRFGFDPQANTNGRPSGELTIAELLAIPAEQRTGEHRAILINHFEKEFMPELHALRNRWSDLDKERDEFLKGVPKALVWREMEQPRPAHILARGDYRQPAEQVERDVPAIFPPLPNDATRDRLALARWLTSKDHPLTSRVLVNRLWTQFFGEGLVRTPEDFGIRGEPPTHPELLDWLAVEMIDGGWDIKHMQRRIVLSATYRQSSAVSGELLERDPENRLLARGARFRLSAEEIRDTALAASGLLTRRLGGQSVYPYQPETYYSDKEDSPGEWFWPLRPGPDLYRRGLYTFWRRTTPYPMFQTFDAPSRGDCTVARMATNTPLQALATMNDPTFVESARVLGERTIEEGGADVTSRLTFAFRSVLSRPPNEREVEILHRLYAAEVERYRIDIAAAEKLLSQGASPRISDADAAEIAAWTTIATAILNLDEAITRE